jgi:membrane protease YdiL (CAAX protease family)
MAKAKYALTAFLMLIASILPDLLFPSPNLQWIKIAALLAAVLVLLAVPKWRFLWKFACSLFTIDLSFLLTAAIRTAPGWAALFAGAGFFADVAGNVSVKVVGILPVAAALILMTGSAGKSYLAPGNLAEKATALRWLGIHGDALSWGRLSVISGVLIMFGTVLLSIVTATGFRLPGGFGRLAAYFPLILLLALVNSFCEGLVFRSAVMAPLRDAFPKPFVLAMPTLFFGIAHYQGIPGGPLGAVMSGALGYYMARAMYETGGFMPGWIIHFLQDIAVFSTLALLS